MNAIMVAMIALNIFKDQTFIKMLKRNQVKQKKRRVTKRSKYNSSCVVSCCEVCGYVPEDSMSLPLDTHHINMRCMSDEDGFIGNFHKNNRHNLVVLCKPCHVQAHTGELKIHGWIQRESGVVLNYEKNY